MSFLPTWLLWGGLAASVPVLIHLLFRAKYRVVSWAAMDFLRTSIKESKRRLKFQELLLLLLRIALLLLLALALALTVIRATSKWGSGGAVDVVMVFDVSASMAAKEGTSTRLELAKKVASKILDRLPSSSTIQIITSADRAELIGPATPTSFEQARILINSLRVTDLTTDHLPGIAKAAEALKRAHNPNREVYLFSDMQKRGWQSQSSAIMEQGNSFNNENTRLILVRCAKSEPRNAAVVGIRPQSDLLHRGDRVSISVLIRNTGSQTLHNLNVKLAVVGQREGHGVRSLPELGPHETRGVLLSVELQNAGYLVLRASIDSDDMAQDNELHHIVQVHEQLRVLVVDGEPNRLAPEKSGSFYLQQALQPIDPTKRDRYPVQLRTVSPSKAFPVLLDEADLCVMVDVPLKPALNLKGGYASTQFLDRLDRFVRKGGGLLILPGPLLKAENYNAELSQHRKLLPATYGSLVQAKEDKPFFAATDQISKESMFANLRQEPFGSLLAGTEIRQLFDLRPTKLARVEMGTTDKKPLLVSQRIGEGRVVCSATTCNLEWNDWALWGHYYVPLWRSVMNDLMSGAADGLNRRVGEPILWQVPSDEMNQKFVLTHIEDNTIIKAHPRLDSGVPQLSLAPLSHAGLYSLAAEGERAAAEVTDLHRQEGTKKPGLLTIAPDFRESEDLTPMEESEMQTHLGFEPGMIDATAETFAEVVAEQRHQDWTLILVIVLALVSVEALFAWFCDRSV